MKQQLVTMLELQDAMNSKVNQDWRERNHEWYRAIWVECAELMDHYGWKWWKKQDPDRDQVVLELVDIWHFGLSIVLMSGKTLDECAELIEQSLEFNSEQVEFRAAVETFAQNTLVSRDFDIPGFASLMSASDLSFDDLYRRYVGKNVLNFFRQDHGYKEGTYKKVWDGREDNEHLVDILADLQPNKADFKDRLYQELEKRYPKEG